MPAVSTEMVTMSTVITTLAMRMDDAGREAGAADLRLLAAGNPEGSPTADFLNQVADMLLELSVRLAAER